MRSNAHSYRNSDEEVVARWVENPYWQWFCGFEYFQHAAPIDPSSLTRWRARVGAEGMERLLAETVRAGLESGAVKPSSLERVTVDTTVQPKAIAHPSDARLYLRALDTLVRQAKRRGRRAAPEPHPPRQAGLAQGRPLCPCPPVQAHAPRDQAAQDLPRPGAARRLAQDRRPARAGAPLRPASPPGRTAAGATAPRQGKALRTARARGGVHRQGQGPQDVRVRLQGGGRDHQPRRLRRRRKGVPRQPLRRPHLGPDQSTDRPGQRSGTDALLRRQGLPRPRLRQARARLHRRPAARPHAHHETRTQAQIGHRTHDRPHEDRRQARPQLPARPRRRRRQCAALRRRPQPVPHPQPPKGATTPTRATAATITTSPSASSSQAGGAASRPP